MDGSAALTTMTGLGHITGGSDEYLGTSLATVRDLDDDGLPELLVGSSSSARAGEARLYTSTALKALINGSSIIPEYVMQSPGTPTAADWFSWSMAPVGDFDADGTQDFAIGALGEDVGGVTDAGIVFVYSGQLGLGQPRLITSIRRAQLTMGDRFGSGFVKIGEDTIQGMQYPVLAIGGVGTAGVELFIGPFGHGYPVSGGVVLRDPSGSGGNAFGIELAFGNTDVDGDRHDDLVISAVNHGVGTQNEVGAVYVYSGAPGKLIRSSNGPVTPELLDNFVIPKHAGLKLGTSLLGLGDRNGDEADELLIAGDSRANTTMRGYAFVVAHYPHVSVDGDASIGTTVNLDIQGPPNENFFLFVAADRLPGHFPVTGDFHGFWWLTVPILWGQGILAADGHATFPLTVPNNRCLIGSVLYFQSLVGRFSQLQGRFSNLLSLAI